MSVVVSEIYTITYIIDVAFTGDLHSLIIVRVHSEVPSVSICLLKVDLHCRGTPAGVHLCNTTRSCGECVTVHTDLDTGVAVCLDVERSTVVHQFEVVWKLVGTENFNKVTCELSS